MTNLTKRLKRFATPEKVDEFVEYYKTHAVKGAHIYPEVIIKSTSLTEKECCLMLNELNRESFIEKNYIILYPCGHTSKVLMDLSEIVDYEMCECGAKINMKNPYKSLLLTYKVLKIK